MHANMTKDLIKVCTVLTIFCLFIGYICVGADEARNEQDRSDDKIYTVKLIRDTFSWYTTYPLRSKYWEKLKLLSSQGHAYFFPPNIEGSEQVKVTDEANEESGNSAGQKMKDAAAKSLGETKSSVEETAKSAAKLAGEALHKAAEKMNKVTSSERTDPEDEL